MPIKQRALSLALCALALLTGCQSDAVQEEIWELEEKSVAAFPDGETADRWRGYQDGLREPWVLYELSDGTVLLTEDDPAGPEGDAAYAALSEEVQAAVSAWCEREGRRYDLAALLGSCYARWQELGPEAFEPGRVTQTTSAVAAAEGVVYLVTTVDLAVDPAAGETAHYGAFFDRETGQRLELWSLFTVPEEEARMALASAAGDDPDVCRRLADAIDPGRVLFFAEHLEVEYPAGTFEELDTPYTLAVDYAALADVLAPRALPGGAGG